MVDRSVGLERALLALFVASGFAGLIYQSIWSHYLGLVLGHAAYAQTLVLAIFMGGMALGAWLVSRRGVKWRRLILAYALVELVIGLGGLAFHSVFVGYADFSQTVVYPALASPGAVRAWQWGSAALLIAPQSILLGMTFPLMSGGYLRVAPLADGEILGGLYFTNSIGAALGALVATFLLLPWVGMPGAMAVAGAVNLAVAAVAWTVARRGDVDTAPAAPPHSGATPVGRLYPLVLVAAGITGASSFVYEIGWVRLLNQALGTTVHSFELMLAAFILGLAFGGLWVRRKSSRIGDPVAYAGYAQLWMGAAALLSLPVFGQSFRWVGTLMDMLERDPTGYVYFSLGSATIAMLVMFPAAFFAGMTLPLFTMALLRRGAGEAAIGRVYAANTLGAIVGVFLAVHVLVPMIGLQWAVTLAAIADIVLGTVLLAVAAGRVPAARRAALAAVCVLVLAFSLVAGRPDPRAQASGVFRHGQALLHAEADMLFLRDGKTATVAVYAIGSKGTIATNGKPDATLAMALDGAPVADEVTMLMAGSLPLALHPSPERIAVIGWGSGLTTHTFLGSSVPRWVDTIEIEPAMYEGARQFEARVHRAYEDPRARLHVDDARTFFSTGHRTYDVIVSEPSNPWVSGVAGLFTREFYRFLGSHLADDGIGLQWLQSYELDDPLLLTMVAALIGEFPHVDIYLTNSADLLFVVSHAPLPRLDVGRVSSEPLASELSRVGLGGAGDYAVRRIASRRGLKALTEMVGAVPHSDFHPVVSLQAPRARFVGASATTLQMLLITGMPILDITEGRRPPAIADAVIDAPASMAADVHWLARAVRDALVVGDPAALRARDAAVAQQVERLRVLSAAPLEGDTLSEWMSLVAAVADVSVAHLPEGDHTGAWIDPAWIDLQVQPEAVRLVMAAYGAGARRDPEAMSSAAAQALAAVDAGQAPLLREHLLVLAELGAIGEGRPQDVLTLERTLGRDVAVSDQYGFVRSFLMAWADPTPE